MEAKLMAQAEQLAKELATQVGTIDELNGLFRGLMKSALQTMLNTDGNSILNSASIILAADNFGQQKGVKIDNALSAMKGHRY